MLVSDEDILYRISIPKLTAASVYGIMEATFKAGSRELLTIAAQEELVSPTYVFKARLL
jgi:pyridoxine kinase